MQAVARRVRDECITVRLKFAEVCHRSGCVPERCRPPHMIMADALAAEQVLRA